MEVSGEIHVPVGWPLGKIPRYALTRRLSVPPEDVSPFVRIERRFLPRVYSPYPSLMVSSTHGQRSANHQAMYCLHCCLLLKLITCKSKGTKWGNIPVGRKYYYPIENTLHVYYTHTLVNQLPSVLSSKPTPRMDYREQISRCVALKKMVCVYIYIFIYLFIYLPLRQQWLNYSYTKLYVYVCGIYDMSINKNEI